MPGLDENLGVCSWSLKPTDPQDLIEKVRSTGLAAVQLALVPIRKNPDVWAGAIETLREADIRILSGMFGTLGEDYSSLEAIARTGGVMSDEHWKANQTIVEGIARIADAHDIDTLSFHAGFIPEDQNDPRHQTLLKRIQWIADHFAQHHINVLLRDRPGNRRQSPALPGDAQPPQRRRQLRSRQHDPLRQGGSHRIVAKLLPHVKQVHIKDAASSDQPGKTWGREMPVGEGEVDWSAFMQVLNEANYTGPIAIEREGGQQRVEDVKRAAEHLHALA